MNSSIDSSDGHLFRTSMTKWTLIALGQFVVAFIIWYRFHWIWFPLVICLYGTYLLWTSRPYFVMTIRVSNSQVIYHNPRVGITRTLNWEDVKEAFVKPKKKSLWIISSKETEELNKGRPIKLFGGRIVFPIMTLKPTDRQLLLEMIREHAKNATIDFEELLGTL